MGRICLAIWDFSARKSSITGTWTTWHGDPVPEMRVLTSNPGSLGVDRPHRFPEEEPAREAPCQTTAAWSACTLMFRAPAICVPVLSM